MRRTFALCLSRCLGLIPLFVLGGCSSKGIWLLQPKGPIAGAELHYMVIDVALLAIVIVPTTFLLFFFLWRYRAKRGKEYRPGWSHSTAIEIVVWGIPLLIVGALSYFSWRGIQAVNPYHPGVVDTAHVAKGHAPLTVDVITTDWQWMFLYPRQHIAVANELVVPVRTKVKFRLTSTSVVNSFFIPQIVGQIYAMPGMRTRQALVAHYPGVYHGFSAAFSGPGFSWMAFKVRALSPSRFAGWVQHVSASQNTLDYTKFARFARPTVNVGHRVRYFAHVSPDLFARVVEAVRAQRLHYATPLSMTENMYSLVFRQHSN